MQPFFITATGTDIGKTLVMTTLCWQLKQAGKKITALKPVATGYDPNDPKSDSALILKSCGLTPSPDLMQTITPWRYKAPLAPTMAAERENALPPTLEELVAFCRDHTSLAGDILLVEGIGGVMTPVNDTHTVLDWMGELGWPVVLVTGSYLGAMSHTLTALEALRTRGLRTHVLVVNESAKSTVPLDNAVAALQKFVPQDLAIVKLPQQHKSEPWAHMPLISWMLL